MKITAVLLLTLPFFVFAQKKEYIITLPSDEYFNSDESKIEPTESAYEWKVVTEDDMRHYFVYQKGQTKTDYAMDTHPGELITLGREKGLKYFKDHTSGKKHGPFKDLKVYKDDVNKKVYAYSYLIERDYYFVTLNDNKTYGPFTLGGLWHVDENNLVYSFKEGKAVFLMENGVKHGPFEQVSYFVAKTSEAVPLMIYKKDGKFHTNLDHLKDVSFSRHPTVSEIKSGWLVEGIESAEDKIKRLYLPDGRKLENTKTLRHILNYNGDVLKAIHKAGGGTYAAFDVSYNGKEIGTFALKKMYLQDIDKTDFFKTGLWGVKINSPSSSFAKQEENYFYSASKGLIGPMTKQEASKINFYSGGYGYLADDSTYILNAKSVLNNVAFTSFQDDPDWYAFQQRKDYLYPFKNGKEISLDELPEKWRHYDTEDKFAVRVKRGDDYFIKVKGIDQLYGPITKFDRFKVSTNGKHFGYEKGQNDSIVIDGVTVGKGFGLVFNEKINAFHWWSQEGQKLYVHTHKL